MDKYKKLITKYESAISLIGILAREKDAFDGLEIERGDLGQVRTRVSFNFKKHNDGISKSLIELINTHKTIMVAATKGAIENKESMKIRLRLNVSYVKPIEHVDGNIEYKEISSVMISKPSEVVKTNVHQT